MSMVVKERFKAFQENLKGVHVSVKDVSRAFHENFNRGSRLFQRYFKDFQPKFSGYFKDVSYCISVIAATQAKRGLVGFTS